MSSFITDLPLKNSFIALKYNSTEGSHSSQSRKIRETRNSIFNNQYATIHSHMKILNSQPNTKTEPFLSRTVRFQKLSNDQINFPGPGTYQSATSINNTSISNKGFGIGFVSKDERFKNRRAEIEKYLPGPGEYQFENYNNMQYSIENSIQGQSLYKSKITQSKKKKEKSPGPGSYNPIKIQEQLDPLYGPSFNKSKSNRFKNKIENTPGPGTYTEESDWGILTKKTKLSFFFKTPGKNKEDYLKKYHIITNYGKHDAAYCLKQNDNGGHLFKGKMNNCSLKPNNFESLKIGLFPKKLQEEELEYCDLNKKNLFQLAPSRWQRKIHQFQVPGPAFYYPKIAQNKLSFNNSSNQFLYSPGVLFGSTNPYPS